jgi:hypothetical protein
MCKERDFIAYEWYNKETGHRYLGYMSRIGMGEENGYTKTPLVKAEILVEA